MSRALDRHIRHPWTIPQAPGNRVRRDRLPWALPALITAGVLLLLPGAAGAQARTTGQACSYNNQCQSHRCDLANGSSGQKCIPNDGTGHVGDYCSHNNQCRPGVLCTGHRCGGGQKTIGVACTQNLECLSGLCDRAAGNPQVCIATNGQAQQGQYCSHSNQCRPGTLCRSSQCGGPALPPGAACRLNEDCASNRCDFANGVARQRCIPNDRSGQAGDYCSHSNQCQPGTQCRSSKCGGATVGLGAACLRNEDCISNRCDFARGVSRQKCIPNDGTGKLWESCSHHNQCQPSRCCTAEQCKEPTHCYGFRTVGDHCRAMVETHYGCTGDNEEYSWTDTCFGWFETYRTNQRLCFCEPLPSTGHGCREGSSVPLTGHVFP